MLRRRPASFFFTVPSPKISYHHPETSMEGAPTPEKPPYSDEEIRHVDFDGSIVFAFALLAAVLIGLSYFLMICFPTC